MSSIISASGLPRLDGLLGQRRQMAFHVAAVVQAGQRVGDRHFDRVLHVVAQLVGVAPLADLGARARQQFVLVDRAQQIVVDADLEPAQQPRIVVGVGRSRGSARWRVRSSERTWLHSRRPSKFSRPSETISRS